MTQTFQQPGQGQLCQYISVQWQSTCFADLTELNWQVMRSRQRGDYSGLCSDTWYLQQRLTLACAVADNGCPLRKMNPSWNRWSVDISVRTSRPLHTRHFFLLRAINLRVSILFCLLFWFFFFGHKYLDRKCKYHHHILQNRRHVTQCHNNVTTMSDLQLS